MANDIDKNIETEEEAEIESTLEQTDKKCPSCGGTLDFDPQTGNLVCPYCGNIVEIEKDEEKKSAEELDLLSAEFVENCDWGTEKRVVICKSCGAETVYEASAVSGECPYCGSNQVMEAGDDNVMAPGGVCPFSVTAESAGKSFIRWLKGKLFCPKDAKKTAKAGKMKGIYLPYWTFDADTHSVYTARYGRERVVRRGKETHVVIDWHRTSGSYDEFINDELVCATEKHDEKILSGIEPFNTENNVAYKPEYVAGFASERYSVGLKSAWVKAKEFIKRKLRSRIERKIEKQYSTSHVDSVNVKTSYSNVTYKYLMLPVWISSFTYKGKIYQFMVNGQTGKVSGKVPISPWRVLLAVFIGVAVIALIGYFFFFYENSVAVYY